jgi:hypothetical protein
VPDNLTNQTLPLVMSAILGDIATLTETPDDHDALGLAFYFFAAKHSEYKNDSLDYLGDVDQMWVQEKLHSGPLSPYLDRDIGALGLFLFTLKKFCPYSEPVSEFGSLVAKFTDDYDGLFRNFFTSALAALGLSVACPISEALPKLEEFLKREMAQHSKETFNDAKNLAVAYLLARERSDSESVALLVHESQRKLRHGNIPRSERVFPNFVLLSEIRKLGREDQAFVKQQCEESLDFVRTYSVEAIYPSELVYQYSTDASAL